MEKDRLRRRVQSPGNQNGMAVRFGALGEEGCEPIGRSRVTRRALKRSARPSSAESSPSTASTDGDSCRRANPQSAGRLRRQDGRRTSPRSKSGLRSVKWVTSASWMWMKRQSKRWRCGSREAMNAPICSSHGGTGSSIKLLAHHSVASSRRRTHVDWWYTSLRHLVPSHMQMTSCTARRGSVGGSITIRCFGRCHPAQESNDDSAISLPPRDSIRFRSDRWPSISWTLPLSVATTGFP